MTCNIISIRFLRSTEYAEKTGTNKNGGGGGNTLMNML
jgi:hypothetical protein